MTNIPEGWKLVPADPTPEMVSAGQRAVGHADQGSSFTGAVGSPYAYGCCYRAMLAAAPPPALLRRPLAVKRLTGKQINEAEEWFSNEFGLEAKHSTDFARAIETACAAAWGVKLESGPLPSTGGPA